MASCWSCLKLGIDIADNSLWLSWDYLWVWQGGHWSSTRWNVIQIVYAPFAPFPVGYFIISYHEAGGRLGGFESSPADGWWCEKLSTETAAVFRRLMKEQLEQLDEVCDMWVAIALASELESYWPILQVGIVWSPNVQIRTHLQHVLTMFAFVFSTYVTCKCKCEDVASRTLSATLWGGTKDLTKREIQRSLEYPFYGETAGPARNTLHNLKKLHWPGTEPASNERTLLKFYSNQKFVNSKVVWQYDPMLPASCLQGCRHKIGSQNCPKDSSFSRFQD